LNAIGDEEDSQLGDFIEDKNCRAAHWTAAIQENLKETTTRVLASLPARGNVVLRMRFGHRYEYRTIRSKRLVSSFRVTR